MPYYCGWDGGGTHTTVLCVSSDGVTLGKAVFGPLNVNGAGEEKVASAVRDAVGFMDSMPGGLEDCRGLVIGMAGISNTKAREFLLKCLSEVGCRMPLVPMGDQEIALEGAVEGPGAVLIAGTGTVLFGRDPDGKPFRVGGYGHLIDDPGSGYAIGRDILVAVVRSVDGRGRDTVLRPLVYEKLGATEVGQVISWLYSAGTGKAEVASLAPLLLQALEQGDEAARSIADKAAGDLADLVIAGWRKTGMTAGELALMGGILGNYAPIRQGLIRRCREAYPGITVLDPRHTPAEGAIRIAMKRFPVA